MSLSSSKAWKQDNKRYKRISSATTLTANDSGSLVICTFTADTAVTMPSATVGLKYSFFVNCTGYEVRLTPVSGEYMSLHTGAVQTVSKYVNNVAEIIGEFFEFECFTAGYWSCTNAISTLEAEA